MTEEEARRVASMLRRLNRPGVAAPSDPAYPAGEWRIYNGHEPEGRRDITAEVLKALAVQTTSATLPAGGPPVRGFVIPSTGDVA